MTSSDSDFLRRQKSEQLLEFYLSLTDPKERTGVASQIVDHPPDPGRATVLLCEPELLKQVVPKPEWHRFLRKAFLQKEDTLGLPLPPEILPADDRHKALFSALAGDWTTLRRVFPDSSGLAGWLRTIPERFHIRLLKSVEFALSRTPLSDFVEQVRELLLSQLREQSSVENLRALADSFGRGERTNYPDKLNKLEPRTFTREFLSGSNGAEALHIYLSNRLPDVWLHLDLLRNHEQWPLLLRALFRLAPERTIAQVSPSEFARCAGQYSTLLKEYFEENCGSAAWAKGMTAGWMLLTLDTMTATVPWSKRTLSAFRTAFEALPPEVLPKKIRLGLCLASSTWPNPSLQEYLKAKKPSPAPRAYPPVRYENLSRLNHDIQDRPGWISQTALDTPAKSLLWLESMLREPRCKSDSSWGFLADLPLVVREGWPLTNARKGRFLAALDRRLDLKIRDNDSACDALYPLFQYLASQNDEFGDLLKEIYLFCPPLSSYREREVVYPDMNLFWCWECADWLPLSERGFKYQQCRLCHMGGN